LERHLRKLEKLTVLYVENDKRYLEKYIPFLEEHCSKLYVTNNSQDAYSLYIDKQPDIIIMDLFVAKFNGTTLAKEVREIVKNELWSYDHDLKLYHIEPLKRKVKELETLVKELQKLN